MILRKNIWKGCLCAAGTALGTVLGLFHWWGFVLAGVFLAGYLLVDRRYLRCPNCGCFTNLDRLLYARNHPYHCSNCGKRLHIQEHEGQPMPTSHKKT